MTSTSTQLALFPLETVLFPDGLLSLRVFQPRYIDLVTKCLHENRAFGAVALQSTNSFPHNSPGKRDLETVGVRAALIDSEPDAVHPGALHVRCRGLDRFSIISCSAINGVLEASVDAIPSDESTPPAEEFLATVRALAGAIGALKNQGTEPFLTPFQFEKAGWVANRWCELLPISREAKQRLMELTDPSIRLKLVDQFLRSHGVLQPEEPVQS